jgi:hypothetical protein
LTAYIPSRTVESKGARRVGINFDKGFVLKSSLLQPQGLSTGASAYLN